MKFDRLCEGSKLIQEKDGLQNNDPARKSKKLIKQEKPIF